jgi:hypothetical protein
MEQCGRDLLAEVEVFSARHRLNYERPHLFTDPQSLNRALPPRHVTRHGKINILSFCRWPCVRCPFLCYTVPSFGSCPRALQKLLLIGQIHCGRRLAGHAENARVSGGS